MKITRLEEVTRTYCDMCGKDITHENKYGLIDNDGNYKDVCTGYPKTWLKSWQLPKEAQTCEQWFLQDKALKAADIHFQ